MYNNVECMLKKLGKCPFKVLILFMAVKAMWSVVAGCL